MKLHWIKTPFWIAKIFRNYCWNIPNQNHKIYLTFDDGPTPKVTPWVLDLLKKHDVKASFFCIGKNIKDNPEVFSALIQNGHCIGNHSFAHENGWKTSSKTYLESIENAQKWIDSISRNLGRNNLLFRPPYGKIGFFQSYKIRQMGYKIVMWDVLSVDFDPQITAEACLNNVTRNTVSGSIIVFHDSKKTFEKLQYVLPKAIAFLKEKGFEFEVLCPNIIADLAPN